MKNITHSTPPNRSKGITLVEILLIIALLVILLSFAMPSVGGAAAKAEMTATVENVQHSMRPRQDQDDTGQEHGPHE